MEPAARLAALHEEHASVDALIALLEEENICLAQGDATKLPPLAERKEALTQRLDHLAQARSAWLPDDASAQRELLEGSGALAKAWQSLKQAAKRAAELNQLNGQIINRRLNNTRDALAILQQASGQNATYGPDGQPQGGSGGRPLGSA